MSRSQHSALHLIAGGWLLAAASLPASGAIVYVQVPQERQSCLSAGAPIVCPFDLDQNGTSDLEVLGGVSFTNYISVSTTTGVFGDFNNNVHPFTYGQSIERYIEGIGGMSQGALLLSYGFDGGSGGAFYGKDAYMGFSFILGPGGTDFYNGWFHIQEIAGFGPLMLEYAYQTEPNIPILAGQIPEPSTAAYIGGSAVLLWQRNANTRKQNKALQRTARGLLVSTLHLIRRFLGFGGAHSRP